MNEGGAAKSSEYSYDIFWNDDIFFVDRIKINSQSIHDVLAQIVKKLAFEHDQTQIEREFQRNSLQVSFMKYNKWYSFTNVAQLESAESLKITCTPHRYGAAYCLQDSNGRYIFYSIAPPPNDFEYIFCECAQIGSEIRCTTASGFTFKVNIESNPKCHNKWCNKDLVNNMEVHSCNCLLIKGEAGCDVLAGYCSIKCAMQYRTEKLEHMKQETLKSFRFLVRASRGDIRLMRILRGVHDKIEHGLRKQMSIHETIQCI